jgi:hypothetical protein
MSKFKTIQQQRNERMVDAMFAGLENDISLKTAMEVMFGLRPESDLDELRKINEDNLKAITEQMTLTLDASGNQISVDSNNEENGNDSIRGISQGHINAPSDDTIGCVHSAEQDDEVKGVL